MGKKIAFLMFFSFLCLFNLSNHALANFDVIPEIPENNIEKSVGYFYLRLAPNTKQTLNFKLTNDSNQPQKISVNVDNSSTADNGQIDTSNFSAKKPHDSSLKYDLTKLISYNPEIIIPANGEIHYPIDLTTSNQEYNGIVMGGISFTELKNEENSSQNTLNMVIPIVLVGRASEVKSKLKLKQVSLKKVKNKTVIYGNLQNPTMSLIFKVQTEIKIYAKKDKKRTKILFTKNFNNLEIAPNSNFDLTIKIPTKIHLPKGDYVWVQTIKSSKNSWNFSKNFYVNKSINQPIVKTNQSNTKNSSENKNSPNSLPYVFLILVIIVILGITGLKKFSKLKK